MGFNPLKVRAARVHDESVHSMNDVKPNDLGGSIVRGRLSKRPLTTCFITHHRTLALASRRDHACTVLCELNKRN